MNFVRASFGWKNPIKITSFISGTYKRELETSNIDVHVYNLIIFLEFT